MIDAYYRNGKLSIAKIWALNENKPIKEFDDSTFDSLFKDDNFIKNNYKKPLKRFLGSANVSDEIGDKEILKNLKRYFEISSKTTKILENLNGKSKGVCSYCGAISEVVTNKAFIFPFERKINSIVGDSNRLVFCKKCAFTFYSAMASLYKKKLGDQNMLFFFDSYDVDALEKATENMRHLQDPNRYMEIKNFDHPRYTMFYPYETMLVVIFQFIKNNLNYYKAESKHLGSLNLYMTYGRDQLYGYMQIDGSTLQKLSDFFIKIIKAGRESENISGPNPDDRVFFLFFENLLVGKGKPSERAMLREKFSYSLLKGKIDFITLNEILMEKTKNGEKLPLYYSEFIYNYLEAFNLDKDIFQQINGLGYKLGLQMKGTNLDNYIWEIFRARGVEQFLNSLVELQSRLGLEVDLRPINDYENWKEAKAILLNGMLNALYGRRKENEQRN